MFKIIKLSLPGKLVTKYLIKREIAAIWEANVALFSYIINYLRLRQRMHADKRNKQTKNACYHTFGYLVFVNAIVWDGSWRELNQFILTTDFGLGFSEWSNQHLKCLAMRLAHWLVQLSYHILYWDKDLIGKCVFPLFFMHASYQIKIYASIERMFLCSFVEFLAVSVQHFFCTFF